MSENRGIIWKALFGEEFAEKLNPNSPEAIAYINAVNAKRKASTKEWLNDGGQIIIDEFSKTIKAMILQAISYDRTTTEGRDKTCRIMDDVRTRIEFLVLVENLTVEHKPR